MQSRVFRLNEKATPSVRKLHCLVQLGSLAGMAQALDWLLLTGVTHSRKELGRSRKKAFFKLFLFLTVPALLHRTRMNQLKVKLTSS